MPAIDVQGLSKVYADGTVGVSGVTFAVQEAEAYGFLGPNGAGKSTTIRILVTLLRATTGKVHVGGHAVEKAPDRVRRLIGYAGQFIAVDRDLTVRQNLLLQARLQGMGRTAAKARCDGLIEEFALSPVARRRTGALSGGMRRRVELVQALVHRPTILFLDEPTTGLDPTSRTQLWSHLADLRMAGTTIFLTTQYLEEADRLCDRVAIVNHGRLVASDTPAQLKALVGDEVVTVEVDGGPGQVHRAVDALAAVAGVGTPVVHEASVSISMKDAGRRLSDLVRVLDHAGVVIGRLVLTGPSLDDVFVHFTGQRAERREPVSAARAEGSR